jgi:hypothetical protein
VHSDGQIRPVWTPAVTASTPGHGSPLCGPAAGAILSAFFANLSIG